MIEREVQDPVEYATMWLRDGGLTPERHAETFDAALGAWIGDFEARGVEGIASDTSSSTALRAPEGPGASWRRCPPPVRGSWGHTSLRCCGPGSCSPGSTTTLLPPCARCSPPTSPRSATSFPGRVSPPSILLRQGGGLGRTVQASTAVAALAGCDGELSVGQIASAVASLTGVDADALRAELVEAVRRLATHGFLGLDSTLH